MWPLVEIFEKPYWDHMRTHHKRQSLFFRIIINKVPHHQTTIMDKNQQNELNTGLKPLRMKEPMIKN